MFNHCMLHKRRIKLQRLAKSNGLDRILISEFGYKSFLLIDTTGIERYCSQRKDILM